MINLMWEGGSLVGHYSVSAIELSINTNICKASLSGTTMTHPDFKGKGIFSSLALFLYERIASEHDVNCVLGFPNNNSHYGLIKKSNWRDVGIIPTLSLDSSRLENIKVNGLHRFSSFSEDHADFVRETIISLGFRVFVNRSVAYLNWRYRDCPVNDYQCFEYIKNGEILGIIVAKTFASLAKPGYTEVDIVEMFCGPHLPVIRDMLTGVKSYFIEGGIAFFRLNAWISLLDARHLQMERMGFLIGTPLTYMCSKDFTQCTEQIYDFQNWYISMGDSDVY